jgi:aspartate ammonia-lyase
MARAAGRQKARPPAAVPPPSSPEQVSDWRTERDPLGAVRVPANAYYGVQTQRALENFPISGLTAHPELVTATVLIKKAAAEANRGLRRLDPAIADAIARAADEILAGQLRDQFVVDVYQAGAGTSHNMNTNEVLANRAAEILGAPRGDYTRVHPNDHVNMGQSTNDVFPTATRLAILLMAPEVTEAARELAEGLRAKAIEFGRVLKTGRTHLQDAVPMTLGQEFSGYSANVEHASADLIAASRHLRELNLGATAVGTGLNAGHRYTRQAIVNLAAYTGLPLRPAGDRFRVTQSMGDVLAYSGALRRLAVEVSKVASDLRLLSMGPRAGIAEIQLPAVQPGSSIMPGKVNPSVPEMVNQVCYQVIGCDAAILAAADAGQLELNVMMPVIAWNALHATRILTRAMQVLQTRCVAGIVADEERCRELLDRSTAAATALSPFLGYAATAEIAKTALRTGRSISELVRERQLMPDDQLAELLSPEGMTIPGVPGEEQDIEDDATPTDQDGPADPAGAVGGGDGERAAARTTVPAGSAGRARGSRSRRVAAARARDGRTPDRGRKHRR